MYALVDCNSFFASCERIFRPDLRTKPVVVLSNNDGCVIARSSEAKALNIPMGAVAHEYEYLFKRENVAVFSTNFTLYGDLSSRVMRTLQTFTDNLEVYSVDEAFLDLSHIPESQLKEFGEMIHKTVLKNIGLPVSVGVAKTKTLAKLANHIAKKYKGYNNSFVVEEEKRELILKKTAIASVWGIGWNLSKMLQNLGVETAFDFVQLSTGMVQKKMGIVGKRLHRELLGYSCLGLEEIQAKKHIATTRTFAKDLMELEDLQTAISNHAANSCKKLRSQNSAAWQVYVFVRTNSKKKQYPQYRRGITVTLSEASNSSLEIVTAALQALKLIFKPGYRYKKAGVILNAIVPANQVQKTLFPKIDSEKHNKLMLVMDKINASKGNNKVRLAIQNFEKKKFYRQERLSKQYTTKWSDIIEVKT